MINNKPQIHKTLTKVPEITVYFWITKILTTGMGESTSDFLNLNLGPVVAVPIMLILLGLALKFQFRKSRYVARTYWSVVVMVSIFGTTAADALHILIGIPYLISTSFYLIVLIIIFIYWYRSEKTLSIHSVFTRRREMFYWATVLATFALGTAAGDMTATTLHIGYFSSGLLFAGLIAIPALAHWWFNINEIFTFWFAYILTRPLGASFADWMAVPHSQGGLGFGTGPTSLGLFILVIMFVGYLAITKKDIKGRE